MAGTRCVLSFDDNDATASEASPAPAVHAPPSVVGAGDDESDREDADPPLPKRALETVIEEDNATTAIDEDDATTAVEEDAATALIEEDGATTMNKEDDASTAAAPPGAAAAETTAAEATEGPSRGAVRSAAPREGGEGDGGAKGGDAAAAPIGRTGFLVGWRSLGSSPRWSR